jgi:hypothetical protein
MSPPKGFTAHLALQESDVNPFTQQPHTPQYMKILEARKKLPVFAHMDEFLTMVSKPLICGALCLNCV